MKIGPHKMSVMAAVRCSRPRSGVGFSLVEVLVAMVLTAGLVSVLMMVASASAQDRSRLARQRNEAEPGWVVPMARQIESDLLMASGMSGSIRAEVSGDAGSARIYIVTYNAGVAGVVTPHQPVLVAYRLVDSERGGVLLREEYALTHAAGESMTTRGPSVQVIAIGIEAVVIGGNTIHLMDQEARPTRSTERSGSNFVLLVGERLVAMHAIAAQVSLTVTTTGSEPQEPHSYQRTLLTR